MKEITKLMINEYKIKQLGYDFMGYTFVKTSELSYHHLIIPRRHNGPMTKENGAILKQDTSHNYLHTIERIDPEIFYLISSELIDENIKGRIDIENLKAIRDLLVYFENEHSNDITKKGHYLIKQEYMTHRIDL